MVKDSRTALRPGPLRPLNAPRPVKVAVDQDGNPVRVLLGHNWRRAMEVQDRWRIDDEWWRASPMRRTYYQLILEEGAQTALFLDELIQGWFSQRL